MERLGPPCRVTRRRQLRAWMREFALLRGCRNSFGALGFLDWFILRCSGVRWLGLPVVRCTNRSCATVPGGGTSCAHHESTRRRRRALTLAARKAPGEKTRRAHTRPRRTMDTRPPRMMCQQSGGGAPAPPLVRCRTLHCVRSHRATWRNASEPSS